MYSSFEKMTNEKTKSFKSFPLYAQILLAMAVGTATGLALGPKSIPLGELGKLLIQLIKVLAAPLLFFAILDAFLRIELDRARGKWLVFICLINTVFALAIGLILSNTLQPGTFFELVPPENQIQSSTPAQKIEFLKFISGLIPTHILQPFIEQSILTLVVLAVFFGLALRKLKNSTEYSELAISIEALVLGLFRMFEILLGWVIRLIPFAVFGVLARTIGEHGFAPLKGLSVYLGVALLGLLIHILIVYQAWIVLIARDSLKRFWNAARDAVFYALGASSSLATLPVTLKCIEKLKVSQASARMAACVGTNFNNDGIILYEAMAVLFVAQAYGIQLSIEQQIAAALSCVVAGIGIAGVPEAGLISLALVLGTVGLPLEIVPLLLTVDWILSRARAMTNVLSDILVSRLLDHFTRHSERS